jgi:hypothetical protein
MGQPYIDQDSFAWLEDDGDLEANTAIGATNDDLANPVFDTNYRLRFLLKNTGSKDLADGFRFEYSVNGGTWTPITTSSSFVRSFASVSDPNPADGDATAQRIGVGTFDEGYFDADGTIGSFTFAQTQESENEFCFQFRSVDISGETIELRMALDDGVELNAYTNTPSSQPSSARRIFITHV